MIVKEAAPVSLQPHLRFLPPLRFDPYYETSVSPPPLFFEYKSVHQSAVLPCQSADERVVIRIRRRAVKRFLSELLLWHGLCYL